MMLIFWESYVVKYKSEFSYKHSHQYYARNDDYFPPKYTTALYQRNLTFLSCKIFNKLLSRFKTITSYTLLKSAMNIYFKFVAMPLMIIS